MVIESNTIHRLSAICSDQNVALYTCLSRFLTNLRLFGRDAVDMISEIAIICYFPSKTEKQTTPEIDTINYAYSATRPTLNQLRPFQLRPFQLRPFRLVPIIPMAPLQALQS